MHRYLALAMVGMQGATNPFTRPFGQLSQSMYVPELEMASERTMRKVARKVGRHVRYSFRLVLFFYMILGFVTLTLTLTPSDV